MKKLLLLTLTIFAMSSCGSDDGPEVNLRGKATFMVGNEEKSFTMANSFNSGVLALGNSTDEMISLYFNTPSSFPTTYNMTSEDYVSASYTINNKTYDATNGVGGIGQLGSLEIVITDYKDAKISGTFTFSGVNRDDETDKIVITNGVFTEIPDL